MAQLILTHSSTFHRALRSRGTFPLTMRVGKFFLFFSMTFLIGLLGFFYLVKFTEIHTKGYELRKLELERDKLMGVREVHSANIASLKTLNAVRASSLTRGMIPARSLIFIREEGNVAYK